MQAKHLLSLLCIVQLERLNTAPIDKLRESIKSNAQEIREEIRRRERPMSFLDSFKSNLINFLSPPVCESLIVRIPFSFPLEEKGEQIEDKHLLSGNEMNKLKTHRIRVYC